MKVNKDLILIRELKAEMAKTESGLVLSAPLVKGQPKGSVLETSDASFATVGSIVVFKSGTGWEHDINDEKVRFLRFDDVLAVE